MTVRFSAEQQEFAAAGDHRRRAPATVAKRDGGTNEIQREIIAKHIGL
ncbi:hypothetical protein [Nocardia harenae]|nr:hypothetical protein [Nocardia harenae]